MTQVFFLESGKILIYNTVYKEVFTLVIDFHTHCFPDQLAPKAVGRLSFASGGLQPHTDGTVSGLRASMARDGVDLSVVLNIATNARQQRKVNDFAAAINGGAVVAFGSVFPDSPDALDEVEYIHSLGLKGIKLHPDYQGFSVDDPALKPLYRKISSLGLVTVFHAGLDYGFAPPYGATTEKMATALAWFDTPVVAAHWGGLGCGDGVLKHLCGRDIYFDTSFGYGQMPKYYAQTILDKHGVERMLFGTDTPWHTPAMERRLLDTLELTEDERTAILCGNARRLLKL